MTESCRWPIKNNPRFAVVKKQQLRFHRSWLIEDLRAPGSPIQAKLIVEMLIKSDKVAHKSDGRLELWSVRAVWRE